MFGFPAPDEGADEERAVESFDFVRAEDLDEVDWRDFWERIYVDEQSKDKLVNYGVLEQQLQAADFDQMTLGRHGAVLLSGPPGTGKTTLAKGAAAELARRVDREALGVDAVIFKQIRVRHLFSSDHGDSPKLVEEAFEAVVEDAADRDVYQVVLLDEVESLFANRGYLTETDPMDAIRAVNTALDALDTLAEVENVYVIATSNQPGAVDSAFVDRTDEQIYVGNPAPRHRRAILADIFGHLEAAFGVELSPTDTEVNRLVELSDGFSGRRMRKSVLSALARNETTVTDPETLTVDHLLEEFEHKRAMLNSSARDYITLGETPDEPVDVGRDGESVDAEEDGEPADSPPAAED